MGHIKTCLLQSNQNTVNNIYNHALINNIAASSSRGVVTPNSPVAIRVIPPEEIKDYIFSQELRLVLSTHACIKLSSKSLHDPSML